MIAQAYSGGDYYVPTYRLYRLDGAGRISGADWVEAADDDDARLKAQNGPPCARYEIWDRDRLVERSADKGSASVPPPQIS
jgi:hypothetical protein